MRKWIFMLALALTMIGSAAYAQDQSLDDRLREALRKMTVDLRSAQDSQAALQAALDQAQQQRTLLQQQVDKLTAQLAAQPAAPATAPTVAAPAAPSPELAELHVALQELQRQNGALQGGVSHWQTAYQQAATIARAKDQESHTLAASETLARQTLAVCTDKNTRLIGVANDILHLYQTQDFRSLLVGSYEPLLGIKKVELENVIQDNEDRIRDQKYYNGEQPRPSAPPSQPAAPRAGAQQGSSK